MTTKAEDHFDKLRRVAMERGMEDYGRGMLRRDNPHKGTHATDEAQYWYAGWDNAQELDELDHLRGDSNDA